MCAFFSTLLLNTFDIQSTCVNYRIITQWVRVRGRAHTAHTAHRLPTSLTLLSMESREHFVSHPLIVGILCGCVFFPRLLLLLSSLVSSKCVVLKWFHLFNVIKANYLLLFFPDTFLFHPTCSWTLTTQEISFGWLLPLNLQ